MKKHLRMLAMLSCASAALFSSSLSHADEPATAAQPETASTVNPATIGNDVVLLNDGSMVRGTIAEVAAGKQVVIVTLGNIARTFPMDQVKYYGPGSGAPGLSGSDANASAQHGSAELRGPGVKLHLEAADGMAIGLTYYVKGAVPGLPASDGYTRLCTAPCDISIPAGTYHFATTSGSSTRPTLYRTPLDLNVDATLKATHKDNQKTRTGGWVVFGLGLGTASILSALAVSKDKEECTVTSSYSGFSGVSCEENESRKNLFIAAGIAGLVGLVALVPALKGDQATVKDARDASPGKSSLSVHWPALAAGRFAVSF